MNFDTYKFTIILIGFITMKLYCYSDADNMFNGTITCPGKKQVYIGNFWLVQYLQSYITVICPEQNTGKNLDTYNFLCYIYVLFGYSGMDCEKKIDETFSHCYTSLEDNAWSGQKSDLPQILKDIREQVYKTQIGKRMKALRAKA